MRCHRLAHCRSHTKCLVCHHKWKQSFRRKKGQFPCRDLGWNLKEYASLRSHTYPTVWQLQYQKSDRQHLLSCSVIADAIAAIFCCVHGKADCVDIELITKFAKCIDIYILRIPSQIVCTYTLNLEDRLIFVHYKSR